MDYIKPPLFWLSIDRIYKIIFSKKKYKEYLLSMTHGSLMTLLSGYLLIKGNLQEEMTPFQKDILYLSRGYFMYDLINVCINKKYLFIFHHISLILFFNIFEKYNCGKLFVQALFIGEVTNPFLQLWTISKNLKYKNMFKVVNNIFSPLFLVVRGICMPYFFYTNYKTLENKKIMSTFDSRLILTLSVLFNVGNFMWSRNLLKGYLKWISKKNN